MLSVTLAVAAAGLYVLLSFAFTFVWKQHLHELTTPKVLGNSAWLGPVILVFELVTTIVMWAGIAAYAMTSELTWWLLFGGYSVLLVWLLLFGVKGVPIPSDMWRAAGLAAAWAGFTGFFVAAAVAAPYPVAFFLWPHAYHRIGWDLFYTLHMVAHAYGQGT